MSKSFDPRESVELEDPAESLAFYQQALKAFQQFCAEHRDWPGAMKSDQFERSSDGFIKRIMLNGMRAKKYPFDMYEQLLPPGKATGRHRHLSEEVFYVLEGEGFDLHWDVHRDQEMNFCWEKEPKRFEWKQGYLVYIPPYCMHQHFNANPDHEARIVVVNRRFAELGLDLFEQIENAKGY